MGSDLGGGTYVTVSAVANRCAMAANMSSGAGTTSAVENQLTVGMSVDGTPSAMENQKVIGASRISALDINVPQEEACRLKASNFGSKHSKSQN